MIDTKAHYIFLEHVTQDPILKVNYTFIQYEDNEEAFSALEDIIEGINCDYNYENLTVYRKPLKGTTVADLSDDIPSVILTGKLRDMHEFQKDIVDGVVNPRDILYNPEKIHLLLETPFASPFTAVNELYDDAKEHTEIIEIRKNLICEWSSSDSESDSGSEVVFLYETYTARPSSSEKIEKIE